MQSLVTVGGDGGGLYLVGVNASGAAGEWLL